jgi:transcription initiation factor IIF auxiliary subunit
MWLTLHLISWVDIKHVREILAGIKYIKYTLHSTFNPSTRILSTHNDGFKLEANGWGKFKIKVGIILKDDRT